MGMNEIENWEAKLKDAGMPDELPTEAEVAKEAGVELVSMEIADPEAEALINKLKEEDPKNEFGGFPTSIDSMASTIQTLRNEWLAQGTPKEKIKIVIHASCINQQDCVVLKKNGDATYHYNTKKILGYSRDKILAKLAPYNISFTEQPF